MSILVMSKVWDAFPSGGSELLALLAMADWSDDYGRCWPSMAAIARKTRLSRSQAQRIVHGLISDGFLKVTGNETGGAHGSTRQYQIQIDHLTGSTYAAPTGRMSATGSADATSRIDAQDGSHGYADTGRTDATQTIIDTSVTTSRHNTLPKGLRLQAEWRPSDDLLGWAREKRPDLEIEDVIEQFRDFWCAKPGKDGLKLDWDATFRNWVRNQRNGSRPVAANAQDPFRGAT